MSGFNISQCHNFICVCVPACVLPVEVEDSPSLAAGEELVAKQDSAGWPVSCAEIGAETAGTQVGCLLVT